jgi:hypothetical protein
MSSDPTQPMRPPSKWSEQPPSQWSDDPTAPWSAEEAADQDPAQQDPAPQDSAPQDPGATRRERTPAYQDPGATRKEQVPGYQDQAATRREQVPGYQDQAGGSQGGSGYYDNAGYQGGSGYQGGAGYQNEPGYPGNQGYQGGPGYPAGPGYPGGQNVRGVRRPRRRRVRRSVWAFFVVLVLAIVLLIGDRVANAVAENQMASQFTANGLPVKPSVTIEGFPFLTQLAAKDFKKVDISASSIPAGPVTIDSLKATINGLHISGYSSNATATIDHMTATAFISFANIAGAGGLGSMAGITMVPDGPDKLKITASIAGIASDSEEAVIKQTGPQSITVHVLPGNSILSSVLSSFGDFSFTLPKGVPASLRITGFKLNGSGLTVTAAASHATFSQTKK